MDEKIKVSLPSTALAIMKKDCLDFKIVKSNGEINMNAFVNLLVVNYYERFCAHEISLYDDIRNSLISVPERNREKTFGEIVKIFTRREDDIYDGDKTVTLSFKPTKFSQSAVLYIDNAVLPSESISSFYRRLFVAYTKMSKNEREKVIHKRNYELLLDAIARNVKVCIKTANGFVADKVSVFAVASAKDELFNYILGFDGKTNITMRLASAETVVCLSSSANIPDDFRSLLERQLACSPQYPIYKSDNEPIVVQLTPKGKTLFEKIYLYRPTPEKIDGDLYTFNCSGNQVLYYFERFGENALILSPKRLGIFMRNYYHFALKKYKTIYRDGNQNGPGSNKR